MKPVYKPSLENDPFGALRIWDHPQKGVKYVVGADVSEGIQRDMGAMGNRAIALSHSRVDRPDYSCAMVIELDSGRHIATWHGYLDPPDFGEVIAAIGWYYNTAQVIVESNSPGTGVLDVMVNRIQYPHMYVSRLWNRWEDISQMHASEYGWRTLPHNRGRLITRVFEWLAVPAPLTRDKDLIDELSKMQKDPKTGVERARGTDKDDRVMALALALQARSETLHTGERVDHAVKPRYEEPVWRKFRERADDAERRKRHGSDMDDGSFGGLPRPDYRRDGGDGGLHDRPPW